MSEKNEITFGQVRDWLYENPAKADALLVRFADYDALRVKVGQLEKMADTYRMTIVILGDERDALKAQVKRLESEYRDLVDEYRDAGDELERANEALDDASAKAERAASEPKP